MKRSGLVIPCQLFARDMVFPERLTTSGKIGTIRKGSMDYQISLEDLILSSTRR